MKKNLSFHDALDHFVFLYFSNACQAVFVQKDDSIVKNFKIAWPMRDYSWTNGKIKLIIHLFCQFSSYYLDIWARKCWIVICLVI